MRNILSTLCSGRKVTSLKFFLVQRRLKYAGEESVSLPQTTGDRCDPPAIGRVETQSLQWGLKCFSCSANCQPFVRYKASTLATHFPASSSALQKIQIRVKKHCVFCFPFFFVLVLIFSITPSWFQLARTEFERDKEVIQKGSLKTNQSFSAT